MANTSIQTSKHEQTPPRLASGWEALRVFRDLLRWSSLAEPEPGVSCDGTEVPRFEVRETLPVEPPRLPGEAPRKLPVKPL